MIVMKFGGTSVGSAERIRTAASVVNAHKDSGPVVVLSAMSGVTDALIRTGEHAMRGARGEVEESVEAMAERHRSVIRELLETGEGQSALEEELAPVWEEIRNVFTGIVLLRELSARSRDLVSSFGERLMAPIFAAYLRHLGHPAEPVDAREIIRTRDEPDIGLVDFPETGARARRLLEIGSRGRTPVVMGYICATPEGATTTLGRGGSDYTASIIGHAIHAEEIQIWTDVAGVMTADPRIVPDARVLSRISYKEAAEMSYFGAKVLHPKTIMPAADLGIPIRIKNTLDPSMEGTLITTESPGAHQGVKTVTSIPDVSLVSIEGRGMIGVPGIAQRAFGAIAQRRISVLMFSQGSSEQHISMVVSRHDGERTVRSLEKEFEPEVQNRQVDRIASRSDTAIIALVGEGMNSIPGIAARAFSVIGATSINILMIAQGSSELNLSLVVEQVHAPTIVRMIHEAFDLALNGD